MVGRRGRSSKRKMEELQEDHDVKPKSAKEARIEAIPLDASEPAHLTLMTLTPDVWNHHEASEEWSEDQISPISRAEEATEGTLSQGMCWKGVPYPPLSQVVLNCKRVSNGEAFDCETQTLHFSRMSSSKVVLLPDQQNASETIKMEIDTDHSERNVALGSEQEAFVNLPLVCCVEGCGARSDTETASTFYIVPVGKDKPLWAETLNIIPSVEADVRQHVCSKHFIVPTKVLFPPKSKTRKKKTCDMLVAEEAEIIKQGLASGRPKRTPKPNKNYNWAEIVPLIKAEPDELDEDELSYLQRSNTMNKAGSSALKIKEDKENKRPTSDVEGYPEKEENEEEEEEEEDLENISMPSNPRPPPPKPKGRPHRIMDSGTQTEGDCKPSVSRLPLREVKVQCNIASQPPSPCTSCSYLNWLRLEELLADCASKVEGDLCVTPVQECLRKVMDNVTYPTHATNVLKLLIGEERDALENTGDIVLMPSHEDDVEIENVIHPEVEEPMSGLREITPRTWQKKTKWKKSSAEIEKKEEEEVDLDGLGIQEATEMDDEEFHPGYLEEEETEEEDDQGLDDEDWTINKQDRDSKPGAKKRQKKTPQSTKSKKEDSGRVCCRHCRREFTSCREFAGHRCRGRTPGNSTPGRRFPCDQCGKTFTQKISLQYHNIYVHNGERKAACPHCDYRAPDKAKLSVHLRTHSKVRPYVCGFCRASFKFRSTYRSHVARHTNSGNYVCSQCNKAFTLASELREHCRIHGLERPFVCPLCSMTFKQKKRLRVHHRAVHLRDKRYVCEICGSCHINNWNLRAHMKTHVQTDTTYTNFCQICGSIFRGRAGLAAHVRLRHSAEYNRQNLPELGDDEAEEEELLKEEKQQLVLGLPSNEEIEHIIVPQAMAEVEIEVYPCTHCGQLLQSLAQLRAHTYAEHS